MALGDLMASRLVHSSSASVPLPNHHTNHLDGQLPVLDNGPDPPPRNDDPPAPVALLPQVVVLCEQRHDGFDEAAAATAAAAGSGLVSKWRPKDRVMDDAPSLAVLPAPAVLEDSYRVVISNAFRGSCWLG
uniref:Uncharacterized protein n=1 Tax=Oryza brachyantha TaxID=4533 RepID=J3N5F2_ORYBR